MSSGRGASSLQNLPQRQSLHYTTALEQNDNSIAPPVNSKGRAWLFELETTSYPPLLYGYSMNRRFPIPVPAASTYGTNLFFVESRNLQKIPSGGAGLAIAFVDETLHEHGKQPKSPLSFTLWKLGVLLRVDGRGRRAVVLEYTGGAFNSNPSPTENQWDNYYSKFFKRKFLRLESPNTSFKNKHYSVEAPFWKGGSASLVFLNQVTGPRAGGIGLSTDLVNSIDYNVQCSTSGPDVLIPVTPYHLRNFDEAKGETPSSPHYRYADHTNSSEVQKVSHISNLRYTAPKLPDDLPVLFKSHDKKDHRRRSSTKKQKTDSYQYRRPQFPEQLLKAKTVYVEDMSFQEKKPLRLFVPASHASEFIVAIPYQKQHGWFADIKKTTYEKLFVLRSSAPSSHKSQLELMNAYDFDELLDNACVKKYHRHIFDVPSPDQYYSTSDETDTSLTTMLRFRLVDPSFFDLINGTPLKKPTQPTRAKYQKSTTNAAVVPEEEPDIEPRIIVGEEVGFPHSAMISVANYKNKPLPESAGIVVSQWVRNRESNPTRITLQDLELLRQAYGNDGGYSSRSTTNVSGFNLYQGKRRVGNRAAPSPVEGPGNSSCSQFYRRHFQPVYQVEAESLTNPLARAAVHTAAKVDPAVHQFLPRFSDRDHLRFCSRKIVTFGNEKSIGFYNTMHADKADEYGSFDNKVISSRILNVRQRLSKRSTIDPETIQAISYVDKYNSTVGFGVSTTCVYQMVGETEEAYIDAKFIQDGLGCAVNLRSYCAHVFYGHSYSHRTAIPVVVFYVGGVKHTGTRPNINRKGVKSRFQVFAWGAS